MRVNIAGQSQPTDETPTIGGIGGSPFNISCDTGEALVGVFGLANSYIVKRVGVRCVRVDSAARWIGDPVDRGSAGGSTGGAYTKTCPRDFAIAGFKGRASAAVNQLDFECRALDTSGSLVGGRPIPRSSRRHRGYGERAVSLWHGPSRSCAEGAFVGEDRRDQSPVPTGPELTEGLRLPACTARARVGAITSRP